MRHCSVAMVVYQTASQAGHGYAFLALPCHNCGCGIRAKTLGEKDEKDGLGVDAHTRVKVCKWLQADRALEGRGRS